MSSPKQIQDVEMPFLDHLEELRWRIIKAIIGVLLATIISFVFIDFFVDQVFLLPAKAANIKLQNLKPFGQFFLYFEIALIMGAVFSIPNIFYQFWKFIAPALKATERKYIKSIVFFSSLCFFTGIIFSYFLMLPLSLKFAAGFGSATIENNFSIDEYFSIILSVMLGAGAVFELPMLSFVLSKIGIINAKMMRKYRRHAIVAIVIIAAVLTPGTDPLSQVLLAIPLVLLYEISILVSKIFQRKSE